ncbi:MAG: phosphoglycolate phosphatase [Alphaproteobacteria bacterium]
MTGSIPLTRPRAILFDWDNTLVDGWPAIHDALNTTFAAMGHEQWTFEQTRERVRRSLRDSFPEMFGEKWEQARDIFYARFEQMHLEHLKPMPGAGEALAWLAGEGIYLALVSNKTGGYLREEAAALGWQDYFGQIVGATDAAADKPAPEPVHMALTGSGIIAGPDIWFIGDAAIDVQCALAAGLTPVALESAEIRAELARHNIDQFVRDDLWLKSMSGLAPLIGKCPA